MPERGQKRSSQASAVLERPDPGAELEGVGGRRAPRLAPGGGGGYLPTCGISKVEPDPRLAEYRAMGLLPAIMRIAEALGFEAFDRLWRIVDSDPAFWSENGSLELRLRPYRSYLRYQRDRFIASLAAERKTPAEIQLQVRKVLGERISVRHICRIVSGK